tara:strand:- start:34972 stop:35124 length:153 start_codon:yes stop_codon:yes gene_type:complete
MFYFFYKSDDTNSAFLLKTYNFTNLIISRNCNAHELINQLNTILGSSEEN